MQNNLVLSIATPSETDGDDVEIMDEPILDEYYAVLYETTADLNETFLNVQDLLICSNLFLSLILGCLLCNIFSRFFRRS